MASRRHTNFVAASILAQLKADLGEHAQNLQYTRLHDLIIKPLDNDPAAISFKLLFGSIRDQKTGKRDNVYIHLYPATTSGDRPEIQFHSYDQIRGTKAKLYGETIGRNVSAIASAFQIGSRRWSHSKLTALARYYFLEKLAEFQDEHDDEKLKFGLLISKSFKDDLRTVCREFQEARTHSHNPVISSAARISDTSQESELSSVPEDFDRNSKHPPVTLQERTARREEDTKSVEHLTRRQEDAATDAIHRSYSALSNASRGYPAALSPTPSKESLATITELYAQEDSIKEDLAQIDKEMAILVARRDDKLRLCDQLASRKEELFSGMTPSMAFELGREVQRAHGPKRQRLV